jgi:ribosomal protein S18 acetylase RimI-like enzyme
MDYAIRPATLDDVTGITEVARYTWDVTYAHSMGVHNRRTFLNQAYAPEALYKAIEHEPGWFYVAVQMGTVVGFAQYLRRFDAQGELVRIYVHPDHQRRGVGRAFLATGLTAMAATGVTFCYASVEVNNTAACTFYERFDFRRHREYGRFLGDQIIRLVEYVVPIATCLKRLTLKK